MRKLSGVIALLTIALSTLSLISCNRSMVSLDYTNARDEVPTLGNLVFRFDQALVKDSLLDQWDSTQYVSFEPKIPGRFRWEHPDELVFSPSQPLPPATTFKATLKSDILQFSKFGRIKKRRRPDLSYPGAQARQYQYNLGAAGREQQHSHTPDRPAI